jgi:GTP cyclohydrolase II
VNATAPARKRPAVSLPRDGLTEHCLSLREMGDVRAFVGVPTDALDESAVVLAVCYGNWESVPDNGLLVRVQSSCIYGEVFGSTNCDCHDQLERSMDRIRQEGAGVIVYLDQEGRGAGLLTKAKGYELSQRKKIDSFEAYEELGVSTDKREYWPAAWMLHRLGATHVRILTNNPMKVDGLNRHGIKAERQSLWVRSPKGPDTLGLYLGSKLQRGHFGPDPDPSSAGSEETLTTTLLTSDLTPVSTSG